LLLPKKQVVAAVALLDEGATVPFISRYRKELTGGLDDTQMRRLEERLRYLREIEERRETILGSIAEQGKLTPALESSIRAAQTKSRLEDLYLPFKQKRRTKATDCPGGGAGAAGRCPVRQPGAGSGVAFGEYINAEAGFSHQ
jgi:uncharacterized protein